MTDKAPAAESSCGRSAGSCVEHRSGRASRRCQPGGRPAPDSPPLLNFQRDPGDVRDRCSTADGHYVYKHAYRNQGEVYVHRGRVAGRAVPAARRDGRRRFLRRRRREGPRHRRGGWRRAVRPARRRRAPAR
ncbi:MAG: hypothetical protein U0470_13085 [Anaerolineae bacterium]